MWFPCTATWYFKTTCSALIGQQGHITFEHQQKRNLQISLQTLQTERETHNADRSTELYLLIEMPLGCINVAPTCTLKGHRVKSLFPVYGDINKMLQFRSHLSNLIWLWDNTNANICICACDFGNFVKCESTWTHTIGLLALWGLNGYTFPSPFSYLNI